MPEQDRRESVGAEMPFLDHLEELRRRILWSLAALLVGTGAGFYITGRGWVLQLLTAPVAPYLRHSRLTYLSPAEPFLVTLKVSFFIGLLLSLPVILYHFWAFVAPALLRNERRVFFPALFASILLFLGGAAVAFWVAVPAGLRFLLSFQTESLEPMITIHDYLKFSVGLAVAFGLVFELPLVMLILTLLGVLSPPMLRSKRRHAVVVMAFIAMVVTPADAVSMVLMLAPMVLLYEGSLWLSTWLVRRRAAS